MNAKGITEEDIARWFTYHPPGERQIEDYQTIRQKASELALVINRLCPQSPDTTAAIRKVREAVMTANAAIACQEE